MCVHVCMCKREREKVLRKYGVPTCKACGVTGVCDTKAILNFAQYIIHIGDG